MLHSRRNRLCPTCVNYALSSIRTLMLGSEPCFMVKGATCAYKRTIYKAMERFAYRINETCNIKHYNGYATVPKQFHSQENLDEISSIRKTLHWVSGFNFHILLVHRFLEIQTCKNNLILIFVIKPTQSSTSALTVLLLMLIFCDSNSSIRTPAVGRYFPRY